MPEYPLIRGINGVKSDFDGDAIMLSLDRPAEFPAKITGSSGSSPIAFSWTEQRKTAAGTGYADDPQGRTGTTTRSPAYEINNHATPTNSIVFLRERGLATGAANTIVYEFNFGAAAYVPSPTTAVTSVQCVGNDLVVTYDNVAAYP